GPSEAARCESRRTTRLPPSLCLSLGDWPRLPFTARMGRAHSYRARSASKKGTWPLPAHPLSDKVSPHQYNAQPMATVDPAAPRQPLALPDHALVAATVEARLPVHGQFKTLEPLAGDASNRRYFRIELIGGIPRSMILMQLAEPEAFKQSEEAVSG